MIPEPLLLTLFYAIAATAIIGAINARGLTRLAISSTLALFCLGAAVFHTVHYLSHKETMMDALTNPTGLADMPPTFPVTHDMTDMATDSTRSSESVPSPELSRITEEAAQLQNDLATIDLSRVSEMSEADYLQLRNKAPGHVAEAKVLQDQIAGIAASESAETLKGAVENLVSATHNLSRFFNAENGDQERVFSAGFRKGVQAAGTALETIQSHSNGTPQATAP